MDGNSVVIITPGGLVVVDTRTDHASAESEIAEIKKLTTLPVKYIINTHWHYDHVLGNGAFIDAFPGAVIIAQKNCFNDMQEKVPDALAKEPGTTLGLIDQYKSELASGTDASGKKLTDYEIIRHKQTLGDLEGYLKFPLPKYTAPDMVFDSSLTLYPGGLEVRIFSPGSGHTNGDAMVFIPTLNILITGDDIVAPVPYAFGIFVNGQIKILEQIKDLKPAVIVPGHGSVLYDYVYINNLIALFGAAIERVNRCIEKNITVDSCLKVVNFEDFRSVFAYDDETSWAFSNYFSGPVIRSIYQNGSRIK